MTKWFEVYAENGSDPPYILVLVSDSDAKPCFKIYDPKEKDRLLETFTDYEEARNWLAEDEFSLVKGREDMLY